MREDIDNYIRINHTQPCSWLSEHIKTKFGVEINPNTIRTRKRTLGCLTDCNKLKDDCVQFIRTHYKTMSDEEMAEKLTAKLRRSFGRSFVKKLRLKHHWYRPNRVGVTVREVRKCLYCGNDIPITCKNPNQKYCSNICGIRAMSKKARDKHHKVANNQNIKEFIQEWTPFVRKVIEDNARFLSPMDKEDLYGDFIGIIPSLIYGIQKHGYKEARHIKGYIAVGVRNLIKRKLQERIDQNEISLDDVTGYTLATLQSYKDYKGLKVDTVSTEYIVN